MQKLFTRILVPIHIYSDSSKLLFTVVSFAGSFECDIHLLFIDTPQVFPRFSKFSLDPLFKRSLSKNGEAQKEANVHKHFSFINRYCRNKHHTYSTAYDEWNESVIEKAGSGHFDLIIMEEVGWISYYRHKIKPETIAQETNIATLTIPLNWQFIRPKNIIIPVSNFLPLRKLIYGIYMASQYNAKIKLVGTDEIENEGEAGHYLEKSYSLIRENCNINIELDVVRNDRVADLMHKLSRKEPNLLILNPGKQTNLRNNGMLLDKYLQNFPAWPILRINNQ